MVGISGGRESCAPGFDREGWIGDHVVVGAELFAVLEFGRGQGVALEHVGGGEVVEDHVHAGEACGGHVHLLAFERDLLACLGGDFEEQRAGAASGIVGGGGGDGVGGGDADDLGDDPADFGRGVELAFAFATLAGEVPHQIFVGIAEDVVVLGAVLREIEGGIFENGDEVAELLDLVRSVAEFVGVVEVGEVATGEAGVGVDEWLDDLGVDLVSDVRFAFEGDHVLEAGA